MKKKSLNFAFVFAFLLLSVALMAQKNYEKGYIVDNKNDTMKGQIHLTVWSGVVGKCELIKDNSNQSLDILPNEIKSVRTEYKNYVSKDLLVNGEKKHILLEMLFEGAMGLYYMNNENFFVEKGDSIYHLFIEERQFVDETGTSYFVDSKKPIGTLLFLLKDEPSLSEKISSSRITKKSLVKLFKEYNEKTCPNCRFTDYTTKKKQNSINVEFQTGYNYAILRFPTSSDSHSCFSPGVGMSFRFLSINNTRWNYIIGANYSSNDFKGDYTHSLFGSVETYRVGLKYSTLNIPLMVEYSFGGRKVQPTIKLGYDNVFMLNHDISLALVYNESNIIDITNKEPVKRPYQYGVMVGGGVRFNLKNDSSINLNCNFEFRAPSTNAHYFYDKQKTYLFQLNLGYSFKVK